MNLQTQKHSAAKEVAIRSTHKLNPGDVRPLTQALLPIAALICFAGLLWSGPRVTHAQKAAPVSSSQPGSRTSHVAVPTADKQRPHPFESGEELVYVAEFSRALFKKLDVAEFRLTANREPAAPKLVDAAFIDDKGEHKGEDKAAAPYQLKFTGVVSSKGFFTKLFNLNFREEIESTVDPASFTVTRTKKVDEQGKRLRTSETVYRDGKVLWIEKDPNSPSRPPRSAEATFVGQVQDVLSAVYYLRTQRLELGKTFELTVSDSGNVYQVPVRVVEKKRKKTVLGRIETLRVDPEIFGSKGMIDEKGSFSIWLTDDRRHIPVSARIKTEYGTFDVTLRKVTQNPAPQKTLASAQSDRTKEK